MVRRYPVTILLVVLLVGLVGCAAEEPSGLPAMTPQSETPSTVARPQSPQPSTTATTTTPRPPSDKPDGKGREVFNGRIVATTPAAKAVAVTWIGFWQMRLRILNAAKIDAELVGRYAVGTAVNDLVGYVGYLTKNKLHVEGDLLVGISTVAVKGETATVRSCINDWSTDVDARGVPKAPPERFLEVTGTLTTVEGEWRVSKAEITSRMPCTP